MTKEELEVGKIYNISYGDAVQVLCRFKELQTTEIILFDHLHYWNGFESFKKGGYCVNNGITEIRTASQAEKMALLRFSIEHQTI